MKNLLAVLLLVTACGASDREGSVRWPNHRKLEEHRIDVLEDKIKLISVLEQRLHELEETVQQLRSPASPPAQ